MSTEKEFKSLLQDNIPKSWDGNDLLNYFKNQDEYNPPIRRLLGYDTPWAEELGMFWGGMDTWEDLMFLYINKDLWGFK